MNARNRKLVSDLTSRLEALKGEMDDIGAQLTTLAEEEQEKYDNMPEGLQQGEAMQTAAQYLTDAAAEAEAGNVDGALESLGNMEN